MEGTALVANVVWTSVANVLTSLFSTTSWAMPSAKAIARFNVNIIEGMTTATVMVTVVTFGGHEVDLAQTVGEDVEALLFRVKLRLIDERLLHDSNRLVTESISETQ